MVFKRPPIKFKMLTNNECHVLLNETLHRMDFLEPLQDDIFNTICNAINKINENGDYTIVYNNQNNYFRALYIHITLTIGDINLTRIGGQYVNNSMLINSKIDSPELHLKVIKSFEGRYDLKILKTIVFHETTHLYDDWQWMRQGRESLCSDEKEMKTYELAVDLINNENKVQQQIGWCLYLGRFYENNAFINQTWAELDKLKCNKQNVHQKMKATSAYRNYKKLKIDMQYYLQSISDEELYNLNKYLLQNRVSKTIPVMNINEFNSNIYKEKLYKWCECIFRYFIKRYCGVVQHYLDVKYLKPRDK